MSPIDSNVGVFISYGGTMHVTSDRFITFSTKPNLGLKKCAHHACTPTTCAMTHISSRSTFN